MAQSRERRNQRRKQRRPAPPAPRPTVAPNPRRRNLRRVVIAFLILVGLAGILSVSAPGDGTPSGSPGIADLPAAAGRTAAGR
ncbi:MAG: hypothetical protein QNJ12_07790 [Ilumatobacter sp.]|uniref:hypothetical protein n=1 Tax=Ilumatobacter sp. TaxID=1967498 RepID=UPI00260805A5|nr:hypothetical protein [Ilumatobacter sp.]MDJ0768679.1 hypothetical protein [Ilumatobacter sp.]